MIWNTLKIGILVICSNLEFFTLHFHITWYHSMICRVHFAREVSSLIHRVHSDVNLIVGETVQNYHEIEQP